MRLSDTENTIIDAMARAFYVSAWAQREEDQGRSFSGQELMDVAPATPRFARDFALMFAGRLVGQNDCAGSLLVLLNKAALADGYTTEEDYLPGHKFGDYSLAPSDYAKSFGRYVAMQAMGHGVSWFDDHAKFDLKIPHTEAYL